MNVQTNFADQIIAQVLKLEPGQFLHDIAFPGKEREIYVSKKVEIKHLTHKKIKNGDLANFREKQDILPQSIQEAIDKLKIVKPTREGESKLTKKILSQAEKHLKNFGKNNEAGRTELAQEMANYANILLEATMHRRAEIKSSMGILDEEVLTHLGVSGEQFDRLMHEQFRDLIHVNRLGMDILRYCEQSKITFRDFKDQIIDLSYSERTYQFVKILLTQLMIHLNMVNDNQAQLSEQGLAILEKFEKSVINNVDGAIDFNDASMESLCQPLGLLIKALKTSDDPQERKLAFALYAMSQNWVIQPGCELGTLTREVFGHERFSGRGVTELPEFTHFDIKFEPHGEITLQIRGSFANRDYEERGKEFIAHFTTFVKMFAGGYDELEMTYEVVLEYAAWKGIESPLKKLKKILQLQGMKVLSRRIENAPSKKLMISPRLVNSQKGRKPSSPKNLQRRGQRNARNSCHPDVKINHLLDLLETT